MKAKPEAWTIVVAGSWNVRVFSPDWVSKHLLLEKPIQIELPLAAALSHVKLTAGGIVLIPADDRLIVGVQEPSLAAMQKAETVATAAVTLLRHTPTAAVGINFGFEDDSPSEQLTALFRVSDLKALSDFGCNVRQTTVGRSVEVEGTILNITHTFVEGRVEVHLNFHQDAPTADDAAKVLQGRSKFCFDLARNFLARVYDTKIEEGENDQAS